MTDKKEPNETSCHILGLNFGRIVGKSDRLEGKIEFGTVFVFAWAADQTK